MKRFDEESLIAYVDGELPESERQAVVDLIAKSTEARALVDSLRQGDDMLRAALDEALADGPADRLRGQVEDLLPSDGGQRIWRNGGGWIARWRGAVAAGVAMLIVGSLLGYVVGTGRLESRLARLEAARAQDQQALQAAVLRALEKQISGQSVDWRNPDTGHSGVVTPVRTFRSSSGQWCREFTQELRFGDRTEKRRGIACREATGEWRNRLLMFGDS